LHDVLASPHVRAIYIGTAGIDASQSFDSFLTWLLGSTNYWSIVAQYGVGYGAFDGSTYIDASAFFVPGMIQGGLVDYSDLAERITSVLHPPPSPPEVVDAGANDAADDAGEAGADAGVETADASAGDAGASLIPPIPVADAYIFFLPNGVNVFFGSEGSTCVEAAGYHDFDGAEPYAVIPPCAEGRSGMAISHEMAEMATDPIPGEGWFSDADLANAGGEIGDLCLVQTNVSIYEVTQLWSNKDGDCEPAY
jgi:hypothetical protein